jgi:NADH-quinone oxidoreductase subunit L
MQRLSYNKFYIDEFYNAIITQPLNKLSVWFYQTIDKSGINGLVNLVSRITVEGSKNLRTIQTGYTGFYLFAMVAGIIIILLLNFILS